MFPTTVDYDMADVALGCVVDLIEGAEEIRFGTEPAIPLGVVLAGETESLTATNIPVVNGKLRFTLWGRRGSCWGRRGSCLATWLRQHFGTSTSTRPLRTLSGAQ